MRTPRTLCLVLASAALALLLTACTRTGDLRVESKPPGAAIVLDGDSTGLVTPQTFAGLYAGLHVVEVRSVVGFKSFDLLTLPARETTLVAVEFPTVRWKYDDDTLTFGNTPAIADDGTVYIVASGPSRNYLLAFDSTGQRQWCAPVPGDMVSSPVIGDSGTVYVACNSAIAAFGRDLSQKRTFTVAEPAFLTGVVLGSDRTFYAASHRTLYAVSADGEQLWACPVPDSIVARPAVAMDGGIYVLSRAFLNAITPGGSIKWSCPVSTGKAAPGLAIDDSGNVYCRKAPYFYCISPEGAVRWKLEYSGTGQSTSPVIGADRTIYANLEGRFNAVNPDGSVAWYLDEPTRSAYGAPCLAADGEIFLGGTGWGWPGGDSDPGLFCLDATGRLKWTFAPPPRRHWYTPAISGSTVLAAEEHVLWAIGISSTAAVAPWPMFQRDARHTGRATP